MLVSGVAAGLLVGLLAHGDFRRLANLRPRWFVLLLVAVPLHFFAIFLGVPELQRVLHIVSLWTLVVLAAANLLLPGAWAIGVGVLLNALVVTGNGGVMPVSPEAARAAGRDPQFDSLHVELNSTSFLAMFSDVIPFSPFGSVYSVGDVFLAVGAFLLITRTMAPR